MAQAQTQIQEQRQEQRLGQSISAQQLLQAQLVELPIQQLQERIETEMHDNPALETAVDDEPHEWEADGPAATDETDDFDSQREREERCPQEEESWSFHIPKYTIIPRLAKTFPWRAYRPIRWTHMSVFGHFCSYRPRVWTHMHT